MMIARDASRENPVIATPSAVPAAGGCSISITTIINMETPTASEQGIVLLKNRV